MTKKTTKTTGPLRELPKAEKIAGLLSSGNYRLAIKRRFLRKPIIILEQRVVTKHVCDLRGTGCGLQYTRTHWVPAQIDAGSKPGVEGIPIAC